MAKIRTSVEQAIRQPKLFKICATKVPITVYPQLDHTVIVYSVPINFGRPMNC